MILTVLTYIESPEDRELIQRVFTENTRLMVYHILAVTHDRAGVEDMLQNTAVRLLGKIKTLRRLNEGQRRVYAAKAARSVAQDEKRRRGKHNTVELEDSLQASQPTPEEDFIARERGRELHSAISRLPERERDLLIDWYFLELTKEEISRATGIRPESIKQRLHDARRHVRRILTGGEPDGK